MNVINKLLTAPAYLTRRRKLGLKQINCSLYVSDQGTFVFSVIQNCNARNRNIKIMLPVRPNSPSDMFKCSFINAADNLIFP